MDCTWYLLIAFTGGGLAKLSPDWTYIALPTTEMFRMPFAEQLGLMRKALEYLHRRIPDVEKILRSGERQASNSLEMVRLPSWSRPKFFRSNIFFPAGQERELDTSLTADICG